MFKIESTSIVLNRSLIRFSHIQLEETANRNFTGQHYKATDIQLLFLFLLFDAMKDSSVTSPYKSLLITFPSSISSHMKPCTDLDLLLFRSVCITSFVCQILDFIYSSLQELYFHGRPSFAIRGFINFYGAPPFRLLIEFFQTISKKSVNIYLQFTINFKK